MCLVSSIPHVSYTPGRRLGRDRGYSRCVTQKGIHIYSSILLSSSRRSTTVTDHHQKQLSTEISVLVPVETPQIQIHYYHDTEYESILNSPPALCLVNVVTMHHSLRRSDSIKKHPILKSMLSYIFSKVL